MRASAPWTVDSAGWLDAARRVPSPNFDTRSGAPVSLLVVHNISLPPDRFGGPGIAQLFTNTLDPAADPYYAGIAHLRVSAHFLIRRAGDVEQFVSCADRAWHAGQSTWRGRSACNDFSIGVELEGSDHVPFEDAQMHALGALTRVLATRYPIVDVAGHSDIAPGRKTDPGPFFDWGRYRTLVGQPALNFAHTA